MSSLKDKTLAAAAERAQASVELQLGKRVQLAERDRDVARTELRSLRAGLRESRAEEDRLRVDLATLSAPARKHASWLVNNKQSSHHGVATSILSDLHVGEVVRPEEMNGYNKFNATIARQRVRAFFENQIKLTRTYMKGIKYDGAVVAVAGDVVSGGIHDELRETDELSVYQSAELALDWIGSGIETLKSEFGRVSLYFVPGNHGRYGGQKRVPSKKVGASNADTHIGRMLFRDFRNTSGVSVVVAEGISVDFAIYKTRFRLEHLYPAKGGSGISGALSPLLLRVARQRLVANAEGTPFDILMGGHFHTLMMLPGFGLIVNGALKGYDEYARQSAFAPEPPQQAFWITTPEKGVTFPASLFVADRGKEGW
jgi:hypothetical protein